MKAPRLWRDFFATITRFAAIDDYSRMRFVIMVCNVTQDRRGVMQGTQEVSQHQLEWRQPELLRLPIAATANCNSGQPEKTVVSGNEGTGGGKGDCGVIS
jgi:hypothetical protein